MTYVYFNGIAARVQQGIQLAIKGSTFAGITLGDLREIRVPLPKSQTEQDQIAEALDLCQRRTEKEQGYRMELTEIQTGLMQDLLTGKVRVKVDEEDNQDG